MILLPNMLHFGEYSSQMNCSESLSEWSECSKLKLRLHWNNDNQQKTSNNNWFTLILNLYLIEMTVLVNSRAFYIQFVDNEHSDVHYMLTVLIRSVGASERTSEHAYWKCVNKCRISHDSCVENSFNRFHAVSFSIDCIFSFDLSLATVIPVAIKSIVP